LFSRGLNWHRGRRQKQFKTLPCGDVHFLPINSASVLTDIIYKMLALLASLEKAILTLKKIVTTTTQFNPMNGRLLFVIVVYF